MYLSLAAIGGLYVGVSVLASLTWARETVPDGPRAGEVSTQHVLACQADANRLLDELGRSASELVDIRDSADGSVSSRWAQFTTGWKREMQAVDERCGFSELQGSGLGVHYDRIARVYEQIPETFLRYDNLVRRFDNQQADELLSMRRALEKSKKALERRTE